MGGLHVHFCSYLDHVNSKNKNIQEHSIKFPNYFPDWEQLQYAADNQKVYVYVIYSIWYELAMNKYVVLTQQMSRNWKLDPSWSVFLVKDLYEGAWQESLKGIAKSLAHSTKHLWRSFTLHSGLV